MRKIADCFDKQLSGIYRQLLEIEQLNQRIKPLLPESLQAYCQITQFNQGRMNIGITEAAMATELRFYLPTLRDLLRQKAGLYQLTSLSISVITTENADNVAKKSKNPHKLSTTACQTIQEASKMEEYEPLKEIWRKLGAGRK